MSQSHLCSLAIRPASNPYRRSRRLRRTCEGWQEWRGSNPQPPVLETGALPVELHSYDARPPDDCSYMVATASLRPLRSGARGFNESAGNNPAKRPLPNKIFRQWPDRGQPYLMISATTPAPTVRPPSRMAKRRPSSMAIGRDQRRPPSRRCRPASPSRCLPAA